MQKIAPYLIIINLLFCWSCAKTERFATPGMKKGDKEFVFSANLVGDGSWIPVGSKADALMSDLQDNANGNGWSVFAYYSGSDDYTKPSEAEGVIFNKRKVWWDGSAWQYYVDTDHEKEYWPMDEREKVTFFAYGPYKDYNGEGVVTVDDDLGPVVRYTASTNLSSQKDLLWGTNTSGLPHRNVNLATYFDASSNPEGTVDFHFRHAPAKIHFTINGAAQADNSSDRVLYSDNTTIKYEDYNLSNEGSGTLRYLGRNYDAYIAYRTKITENRKVYRQTINGLKILIDRVEMENFYSQGELNLNNPDPYIPGWTHGEDLISYSFDSGTLNESIIYPNNDDDLLSGWTTTYQGVDFEQKELLLTPYNYIYMIPKTADTDHPENNIRVTVYYHLVGYTGSGGSVEVTETTTTRQQQTVRYITTNGTVRYLVTDNSGNNNDSFNTNPENGNVQWTDSGSPSTGEPVVVATKPNLHSQDNAGQGFRAVGSINSDILGGRDYTINLYLDGRELHLTVIPQPWDLLETLYDYDQTLNPVLQALTYDSDFVYQVVGDNVYINNRMGKFYFRLGSGKYLYWQASLIGDDAFAFTDENGEYLTDDSGGYLTSVRGNIGEDTNYIYVKATNTASQVTSRAKLRIYLFDSDNHAVVALPKDDWKFLNAHYTDEHGEKRVQEWTIVQTAN